MMKKDVAKKRRNFRVDGVSVQGMQSTEDSKEAAYCRVCHGESEPGNELYFPCKCDGSIKWVHQDCLVQWLKVSKKEKCELCGEVFRFQKVYKEDAPYHISLVDIVWEIIPRIMSMLRAALQMGVALFMWGICLPLFTNWWFKVCWCSVVNAGEHCVSRIPSFLTERSLEGLITYWYFGLVDVCVIIAASVVMFEVGHTLYRVRSFPTMLLVYIVYVVLSLWLCCCFVQEYQIANNNFKIRQLERRLAQTAVALRSMEEDNLTSERTLFAVADYESTKCEWDVSKKRFDASISRAMRCRPDHLRPGAPGAGAGQPRRRDEDGEVLEEDWSIHRHALGAAVPSTGAAEATEDPDGEEVASPSASVPSLEDRFMMVQSLANDQVYCSRIVERLNTVCATAKDSAPFLKLRDSYVKLEEDLIRTNEECAALIEMLPSHLVPMKGDIGTKHTFPAELSHFGDGVAATEATAEHPRVRHGRRGWHNGRYRSYSWTDNGADESDEDKDTDSSHSVNHADRAASPTASSKQKSGRIQVPWYEQTVGVGLNSIEPTPDNLELRANLLLRQRMREAAERRLQAAHAEERAALNREAGAYAGDGGNQGDEMEDARKGEGEGEGADAAAWAALADLECDGELYRDEEEAPVDVHDAAGEGPNDHAKGDALGGVGNIVSSAELAEAGMGQRQQFDDSLTELGQYAGRAISSENVDAAMVLDELVASVVLRAEAEERGTGGDQGHGHVVEGQAAPAMAQEAALDGAPLPPVDLAEPGAEQPAALMVGPPLVVPGGAAAPPNNDQLFSLRNIAAGYAYIASFIMAALIVPALFGQLLTSHTAAGDRFMLALEYASHQTIRDHDDQYHNLMKLLDYLEFPTEALENDPGRVLAGQLVTANLQALARVALGYAMFAAAALSAFIATYMQFLGGFDQVGGSAFDLLGAVQARVQAAGSMFQSLMKLALLVLTVGLLTPILLTVLTARLIDKSLPLYLRSDHAEGFNALVYVALFVFSYLITVHVWYITLELRRAINSKYLAGILPEAEDQDAAVNANGNQSLFALLEKLKGMSFSHIFKRILIRTSITLPAFVFCVVVPVRWGHLLCPLEGPLKFRLKATDSQIPVEMMLSHIFLPLIIEKLRYRAVVKHVVAGFLGSMAPLLGLEWILAPQRAGAAQEPMPRAPAVALNAAVDPVLAAAPVEGVARDGGDAEGQLAVGDDNGEAAEGDVGAEAEAGDGAEARDRSARTASAVEPADVAPVAAAAAAAAAAAPTTSTVGPQSPVVVLLSSTMLTLLGLCVLALTSSWVLHAPLATGRLVMETAHMPSNNDLYSYPVGLLICWGAGYVVQYIALDVMRRNGDALNALAVVGKWVALAMKVLVVGAIWLAVPPLILGVLLEAMFVMPMRLPAYESPYFPFLQNWAIGLILLKAFTK